MILPLKTKIQISNQQTFFYINFEKLYLVPFDQMKMYAMCHVISTLLMFINLKEKPFVSAVNKINIDNNYY